MADTILITASQRIEARPDVVRAQYRDIDHHIRNDVHPSIRYEWEPAGTGERKIRTTFRILGVPQFDVSLLEDAPDGSFLIRYLEGTNAGMLLVHEFVPLDEGRATDVRLRADAPSTLARKLLGPLFRIGARQVMKKALHEDKVDIEKGTYRADKAAGDLAGALAPVRTAAKSSGEEAARAIVSAACAIVAADGAVDPAERDATFAIAQAVDVAGAWVERRSAELARAATSEAFSRELQGIGETLTKEGVVEAGLVAAAIGGLVSHGMSLGELEALRSIAEAAGFDGAELATLVERVDAALMQPV